MTQNPTIPRAALIAAARDAYAALVADNGEPTESLPHRFGFVSEDCTQQVPLKAATLRTQLAASLFVAAGLGRLDRDEYGECLVLLTHPCEFQPEGALQ